MATRDEQNHKEHHHLKTGEIRGVVIHDLCEYPISYANIIVLNTKLGSMTDADGNFIIKGVPVGYHQLKVLGLGLKPTMADTFFVNSGSDTMITFRVQEKWSDKFAKEKEDIERKCEIHNEPMKYVIVPVGYGLIVSKPEYEKVKTERFPNAEPWVNAGCMIKEIRKTWELRCPKCIRERNEYLTDEPWDYDSLSEPSDWIDYKIDGFIQFAAPKMIGHNIQDNECSMTAEWHSEDLSIEIFKGPVQLMPRPTKCAAYYKEVNEIIDYIYGSIKICSSHDEETSIYVKSFILPRGTKSFGFTIRFENQNKLPEALQIVRSIHFIYDEDKNYTN